MPNQSPEILKKLISIFENTTREADIDTPSGNILKSAYSDVM